eukprot:2642060-Rhodomonas_salina.3
MRPAVTTPYAVSCMISKRAAVPQVALTARVLAPLGAWTRALRAQRRARSTHTHTCTLDPALHTRTNTPWSTHTSASRAVEHCTARHTSGTP